MLAQISTQTGPKNGGYIRDRYRKVWMNALFAHERDQLAAFTEDESLLARTVVRTLIDSGLL